MAGVYFKGGKIVGAASGGDTETFLVQTFENASLSDFTQTGLILEVASPVSGTTSAKLIHQTGINQSFKETKTVPERFRGSSMTVTVVAKSTATTGNVTILFRDETNNIDIQSSQQILAESSVGVYQYGVRIPATCQSFSYTVTALPEAGSPTTYIDDVAIRNYWIGTAIQGQTQYDIKVPVITDWQSYIPTFANFGTVANNNFKWRQVGNTIEVKGTVDLGTTTASTATMSLPNGYTGASPATSGYGWIVGTWARSASSANHGGVIIGGSSNVVAFSAATTWSNTASVAMTSATGTSVGAAGEFISIEFAIAVNELSYYETKTIVNTDLVPAKAMAGNTSIEVPNATGTTSYTPTFGGLGTVTNSSFKYSQTREYYEIDGVFEVGSPTAVPAYFTLPNNAVVNGSLLNRWVTGSATIVGTYNATSGVGSAGVWTNGQGGVVGTLSSDYTKIYFAYANLIDSATDVVSMGVTGINAFNAGANVSVKLRVPILGLTATTTKVWSATQSVVTEEEDSIVRLSGGSYSGGIMIFTSIVEISGNAFEVISMNTVKVKKSGIYVISASADGTGSTGIQIYVNGSSYSGYSFSAVTGTRIPQGIPAKLNINDTITIINPSSGSATAGTLAVSYQGSLKQVQTVADQKIEMATHELKFEGASGNGATDTAVVKFDTLTNIRGDAFTIVNNAANGTVITMGKSGTLSISANVVLATSTTRLLISKNQLSALTGAPSASETLAASSQITGNTTVTTVSSTVSVVAGDVIRIIGTSAATGSSVNNLIMSLREKSVAVSVTNILPQYSDSDSSLRLDTTNGYGSSATRIRRFSNIRQNFGTAIIYVDSATDGATFTARESGNYHISYTDNFSSSANMGLSINTTGLTTNFPSLAVTEKLASTISTTTNSANVSWAGYLNAGDIIRCHTDGTSTGIADRANFSMAKVGKPNVTGVDVTPFIDAPRPVMTDWQTYMPVWSTTSTQPVLGNGSLIGRYRRVGDSLEYRIELIAGSTTTFGTGTFQFSMPSGMLIDINKAASGTVNPIGIASFYDVSVGNILHGTNNIETSSKISARVYNSLTNHTSINGTSPWTWANGDYISMTGWVPVVGWTSEEDTILTVPQTFSSDTATWRYASSTEYTLSTLTNAPIGTFITFTYAINTSTRSQTTTAPTQTYDSMRADGFWLFARPYNAASTAAQPAAMAIQVGKGMKGKRIDLYGGGSKTLPGTSQFYSGTAFESGIWEFYDETTGILYIDAGATIASTTTSKQLGWRLDNLSNIGNGFVAINASKNPALTGLNTPDVVAVRGVQSSGQSFANNTVTIVTWDSTPTFSTNPGSFNTATGIFTSPSDGYYRVSASIFTAVVSWVAVTHQIEMYFFKNNALYSGSFKFFDASVTNNAVCYHVDTVYLAAGETLDLRISIARGASTSLLSSSSRNYISITKVGVQ